MAGGFIVGTMVPRTRFRVIFEYLCGVVFGGWVDIHVCVFGWGGGGWCIFWGGGVGFGVCVRHSLVVCGREWSRLRVCGARRGG